MMKTATQTRLMVTQFDLHQRLYNNALDGFTDEEADRRLSEYPLVNPVKYLAGHLLNSRYGICAIAGLQPDVKWNDLFAVMGQSQARDDISYPGLEEITAEWNRLYKPTRNGLLNLTEENLDAPPPTPFDRVSGSTGELWAFINHHQAYHIGQISILRRAFGKEPMSYE